MKNSRLIASTMAFQGYPLESALDEFVRVGINKIELFSYPSMKPNHADFAALDQTSIAELVKKLRDSGTNVHCINTVNFSLEQMENAFELAAELGSGIVTYNCGNYRDGASRRDLLLERAELNSKLADLGEKYGVTSAVEAPHKLSLADTTETIDEYWSMQDSRVKCTFDSAHLTYSGDDGLAFVKKYAERIVHVHFRDAVKGNSLVRYGEGAVDFAAYIAALNSSDYRGCFSMEYPASFAEEKTLESVCRLLAESTEYLDKFDFN